MSNKNEEDGCRRRKSVLIQQLEVGGFDHNFSYLIHDRETGAAVLVDPCGDAAILQAALLNSPPPIHPRWILLTHAHPDHFSALAAVRRFFPAPLAAASPRVRPDRLLTDHLLLPFGTEPIEALATPGHSPDSFCFLLRQPPALLTGDTLFTEDIGFCDPEIMYRTFQRVFPALSDQLTVYPGHDYGERQQAPLGELRQTNAFLRPQTLAEFKQRVAGLH